MTDIRIRKIHQKDGIGVSDIFYVFFESGSFEKPIMIMREYDLIENLKDVGLKVKS